MHKADEVSEVRLVAEIEVSEIDYDEVGEVREPDER